MLCCQPICLAACGNAYSIWYLRGLRPLYYYPFTGGGKPVSTRGCGARRRRRSTPDGKASWEGSERGGIEGGVEDRKEDTTEGIGEQPALYTRAKRRGAANPDRAGLNRKRQRTGTDFIDKENKTL
jgi:hypothetical protein